MTATIEQLDARLAELESRLAPSTQANPPIVVGELTDVPAPGSPIASAWSQEVSNRIVHRFATKAALDGWAAANGSRAVVVVAGAVRDYLRSANVWVPTLGYSWRVRQTAAQSINPGAIIIVPFNTEDFDTSAIVTVPQTIFVIPVGLDGLWTITANAAMAATVGPRFFISIEIASTVPGVQASYRASFAGEDTAGIERSLPLAAGDTVRIGLFHTAGAAQSMTNAWMSATRIGPIS